jgi:hypothetical protein
VKETAAASVSLGPSASDVVGSLGHKADADSTMAVYEEDSANRLVKVTPA